MFESNSIRGWLLNRALHHQHSRIYNYDRNTQYGSFPQPCPEMTQKFLDLVQYDKGGRIFTYIITLDGKWRFTETGKEFGIDMLSKHTMHSDVNVYISFSGEFFIRRHEQPHHKHSASQGSEAVNPEASPTHPPDEISGGPPKGEAPKDPAYYSLIIDNDSGTYRPNAKMLPDLKKFLHKQLPGLHITVLDCNGDKDKMDKMKGEQRERKKKEGKRMVVRQQHSMSDVGSMSSSDEEDLQQQARDYGATNGTGKKGFKEKAEDKYHDAKDQFTGHGNEIHSHSHSEKATMSTSERKVEALKEKTSPAAVTNSEPKVGTSTTEKAIPAAVGSAGLMAETSTSTSTEKSTSEAIGTSTTTGKSTVPFAEAAGLTPAPAT